MTFMILNGKHQGCLVPPALLLHIPSLGTSSSAAAGFRIIIVQRAGETKATDLLQLHRIKQH
jgi:hypothetical protein